MSMIPLRWLPLITGVVGTLWHSLQAMLAESGFDWPVALRCLVWAPTIASVGLAEPAMDLNGLVPAVLWQASQLLVLRTSPWHMVAVKQPGEPVTLNEPAGELAKRVR